MILNSGHWSLTAPWEKLIKIGVKAVRHDRDITFQLAEVAIPKSLTAADPVASRLLDRTGECDAREIMPHR